MLITLFLNDVMKLELDCGARFWIDGREAVVKRKNSYEGLNYCDGCVLKNHCSQISCLRAERQDDLPVIFKEVE